MIEIFILSFIQESQIYTEFFFSLNLNIKTFRFENQSLSIDVSLHIGSLLAVLMYFYKDIISFIDNKILFLKFLFPRYQL